MFLLEKTMQSLCFLRGFAYIKCGLPSNLCRSCRLYNRNLSQCFKITNEAQNYQFFVFDFGPPRKQSMSSQTRLRAAKGYNTQTLESNVRDLQQLRTNQSSFQVLYRVLLVGYSPPYDQSSLTMHANCLHQSGTTLETNNRTSVHEVTLTSPGIRKGMFGDRGWDERGGIE